MEVFFKEDLDHLKIRDIVEDQKFFNGVYQDWKFEEYEKDINTNLGPYGQKVNPIYRNMLTISTFDFSTELDVNILGHVFENSIGDIEELKEGSKGRRKKEGIFYTPEYITDYICRNTIIPYLSKDGKAKTVYELIQEYSSGEEIEMLESKVMNIKIVDPACGSGAFLNKASDILLEIHKSIYDFKKVKFTTTIETKGGKGKDKVKRTATHIKLDSYFDEVSARRKILIHNIYGVDLNEESVDITKLALFLKVCQENRKLPDLENNIKCGNSLIDDPEYTDKPFKWEDEFPDIFKSGGFDVVIGNPPYVRQEKIKEIKPYLTQHYETYTGVADLYIYFFEKGLNVLKKGGMFSFITSDKFIKAEYGKKLRELILRINFQKFIDYKGKGVFEDAKVDPCVLVLKNEIAIPDNVVTINEEFSIPQTKIDINNWIFEKIEIIDLKEKLEHKGIKIRDLKDLKIYRGVLTGFNEGFIINDEIKEKLINEDSKSSEIIRPILTGKDINRGEINSKSYLIWTYIGVPIGKYPAIKLHLDKYVMELKKRYDKGKFWWELRATNYDAFEKPKLIYQDIGSNLFTIYDEDKYFVND